jgi:hypothetical protein
MKRPSQILCKDSKILSIAEVEQRLAMLAELEHLLKRRSEAVQRSSSFLSDETLAGRNTQRSTSNLS